MTLLSGRVDHGRKEAKGEDGNLKEEVKDVPQDRGRAGEKGGEGGRERPRKSARDPSAKVAARWSSVTHLGSSLWGSGCPEQHLASGRGAAGMAAAEAERISRLLLLPCLRLPRVRCGGSSAAAGGGGGGARSEPA